jgi:hypothetical protein
MKWHEGRIPFAQRATAFSLEVFKRPTGKWGFPQEIATLIEAKAK